MNNCYYCDQPATRIEGQDGTGVFANNIPWVSTCDKHAKFEDIPQTDIVKEYLNDNPDNVSLDGLAMWWNEKQGRKAESDNREWVRNEMKRCSDQSKYRVFVKWRGIKPVMLIEFL